MPAGVFPRAPYIHNAFQLLATIIVKNAGWRLFSVLRFLLDIGSEFD